MNLPSGIDPGHQVGLLLSRLSLSQSLVDDFDQLPIPFRCVAVDMERGEPVVLRGGSLGHALRATMSIPGLFAPLEIDGTLLADGGVLNNVPTDVVLDMGADIVIGVDVGAPLADRSALRSPLSLVNQSITVMMLDRTRRSLDAADVVIQPDLEDVSATDWRRFEEIARRGHAAADAQSDQLLAYAVDETTWAQHLADRRSRRGDAGLTPSFVTVEGVEPDASGTLERRLAHHVGAPLDISRFEEDLTRISGEGRYESLRYRAVRDGERDGLLVDVTPKTHGPPFVNFGIDVGNQEDDIDFNFDARITAFDVLTRNAEARFDVAVGSRNGIGGEYYLPFGATHWFAAPRASYISRSENFFRDGDLIANYGTRQARTGADLGFTFGPSSELRVGYDVNRLDSSINIGDPVLPEVRRSGTGRARSMGLRRERSVDHPPARPAREVLISQIPRDRRRGRCVATG